MSSLVPFTHMPFLWPWYMWLCSFTKNAAAKTVFPACYFDHFTPLLAFLTWLPFLYCIKCKLFVHPFIVCHNLFSSNLASPIQYQVSASTSNWSILLFFRNIFQTFLGFLPCCLSRFKEASTKLPCYPLPNPSWKLSFSVKPTKKLDNIKTSNALWLQPVMVSNIYPFPCTSSICVLSFTLRL